VNPGHRSEKPVTNRLSYGAAFAPNMLHNVLCARVFIQKSKPDEFCYVT
jgi:hypothetical protein